MANTHEDFLSWFRVPGVRSVYVLGCFARHVTIYSQQVRALNLIYSLHKEIGLGQKSVAIIGAGAAGLTAAAAALILGAKVTLLERRENELTLQRNNPKRWLHPHIYDWPFTNEPDRSAGLPILNWTASISEEVAKKLIADWKAVSTRYRGFLDYRPLVTGVSLTESLDADPIIGWNGAAPRGFATAILAVGFGLEGTGAPRESYWAPDDIDTQFGPPERCLVSGHGDGALTDLMRLCVIDFRQDEMISLSANWSNIPSVAERIIQIENEGRGRGDEWMTQEYESLDLPDLRRHLQGQRRWTRTISLAGKSQWPYGRRSSALNKLIVSQLQRIGSFEKLKHGAVVEHHAISGPNGETQYEVKFADGTTETYDRVVLRHGPVSAVKTEFPKIWDNCESLRLRWDETVHQDDRTRVPIWPAGYFEQYEGEIAKSIAREASRPRATSLIESLGKTVSNPKYRDDLARLDEHWKLDAVVGKRTVVLVVGSTIVTELLDRPVAELLRDIIDREGESLPEATLYHRAVVFCDAAWFKDEVALSAKPFIAIGGGPANDLTKWLLAPERTHQDRHDWQMGEGTFGFFRKVAKDCPQVALYGDTAARTRKAVETYIEKQDGLESFLDMCWGR